MAKNTKTLQKQAALLAAQCYANESIAQQLGVRESTVRRWRDQPVFKQALAEIMHMKRQNLEMRKLSMAHHALAHLEMKLDKPYIIDPVIACRIISLMKDMEKLPPQEVETNQNRPKSTKKHPDSTQTDSQSPQTDLFQP